MCLMVQTPTLVGLEGGDGVPVCAKATETRPSGEAFFLPIPPIKALF